MNHVGVRFREIGPVPAGTAFSLDGPSDGTVHPGWVFVHGWVVSPVGCAPVERVEVERDGLRVATLVCGQPRPDVEQALSPRPAAGCGFSGDVDLSAFAEGSSGMGEVQVTAFWDGGAAVIAAWSIAATHAPVSAVRDHAQSGEVTYVRSLLTTAFPQVVVDVGAHDGWTLSNSYPFVAAGWQAVLIEPLPSVYSLLVANHRRHPGAILVNAACSDHDGLAPLFVGRDGEFGMNSTLSVDDNDWMRSTRSERTITVEVRRLDSILAEAGLVGDIGLLLVDCEGMDLEALSGLDPNVHRPWVVITEQYPSNPSKEAAKAELLRSWGMVHHGTVGVNDVWTQPFLAVPGHHQ